MAPADMGKGGGNYSVWKCCKLFLCNIVDELFMHYFHNLSSASRGFAPDSHRGSIPGPRRGTFIPDP